MPRFIGHYLATGSNPKIIKGDDDHYITAIQHFLPSDLSGHQMCGMEKIAGCRKDCLNTAGRGQSPMVVAARMRKTLEFAEHRPLYNYLIDKDLVKYETFCHRHELHGSVRMGGTDDRPWHQILKMEAYDLQFYNYTKHWRRASSCLFSVLSPSMRRTGPVFADRVGKATPANTTSRLSGTKRNMSSGKLTWRVVAGHPPSSRMAESG